jgi:hypothetical protein
MIPEFFEPITDHLSRLLNTFGDERCDALYAVCKNYTIEEMDFIYLGMTEDMSRLPSSDFGAISDSRLKSTYQMILTAAHAAPMAVAFKVLENEKIKQAMKRRGGARDIRALLGAVGEAINMSRADSLVIKMPNMERHDPVILAGAVAALVLRDTNGCSAELIRYMGENWRALSAHSEVMAAMDDFDIITATSLVEGGAASLVGGAL